MRLLGVVPRGLGKRQAEAGRSPSRVQESRPPWSTATRWASARPSPTPSGLLVTNASHRVSATSGAGPGPVSPTSIVTSPLSADASRLTSPPGPGGLDRVQGQVQDRGPQAGLVGHDARAARLPGWCRSRTLACWHAGAPAGRHLPAAGPGRKLHAGCRSTRPRESSPFHLLLGHGQLPQGDVERLVAAGGGNRLAWSWTLILAPVSEFRS